MFVLWYCYKRGREERLEQEQLDNAVEAGSRIEELADDPQLPAPHPETTRFAEAGERSAAATSSAEPVDVEGEELRHRRSREDLR